MLWFMKDLLQLLSKDVESSEIYRKDQVSLKVIELQIYLRGRGNKGRERFNKLVTMLANQLNDVFYIPIVRLYIVQPGPSNSWVLHSE